MRARAGGPSAATVAWSRGRGGSRRSATAFFQRRPPGQPRPHPPLPPTRHALLHKRGPPPRAKGAAHRRWREEPHEKSLTGERGHILAMTPTLSTWTAAFPHCRAALGGAQPRKREVQPSCLTPSAKARRGVGGEAGQCSPFAVPIAHRAQRCVLRLIACYAQSFDGSVGRFPSYNLEISQVPTLRTWTKDDGVTSSYM